MKMLNLSQLLAFTLLSTVFVYSPASNARNDEWGQRCTTAWRDVSRASNNPNETIVAAESYLSCMWIFIPGDGKDAGVNTGGDGGIGPGISISGGDLSGKSCGDLDTSIEKLTIKKQTLTDNRRALDAALDTAIDVADKAEIANRQAQSTALADQMQCEHYQRMELTYRIIKANQQCKTVHPGETRAECVDNAIEAIATTPYTNDMENACYVKAVQSESAARTAASTSKGAADFAGQIFNERADVARQLGRVTDQLKQYKEERDSRCKKK